MSSILKTIFSKNTWIKFLNILVYTVLYIWQLPQNIFGIAYMIILRGEKKMMSQRNTSFYIAPTLSGGISLGNYIFISKDKAYSEPVFDHEFGHCIQSRILGPLYLPIVGICSGIHCLTYSGRNNYYEYWTERWANNLGGIKGYKGEKHCHKPGLIFTTYSSIDKFCKDHF